MVPINRADGGWTPNDLVAPQSVIACGFSGIALRCVLHRRDVHVATLLRFGCFAYAFSHAVVCRTSIIVSIKCSTNAPKCTGARACARVLSNVLNTRKHFRPRRARWPSELPPPTPRSAVAGSPIAAHRKFIQLNTHYKPDPLSGNAAATRTCLAAPVRVRSAQVIARRCALRERIARFVGC